MIRCQKYYGVTLIKLLFKSGVTALLVGMLLKLSLGGKRLGKCVVSESWVSSGWSEL